MHHVSQQSMIFDNTKMARKNSCKTNSSSHGFHNPNPTSLSTPSHLVSTSMEKMVLAAQILSPWNKDFFTQKMRIFKIPVTQISMNRVRKKSAWQGKTHPTHQRKMKRERRVTHLPRVPIRTRATLVLESELTVAVACIRLRVPGAFLWEAGNATTLSSDDCCCCPAKLSLLAKERDNLPLPTHPLFFFFAPQNLSTAAVV